MPSPRSHNPARSPRAEPNPPTPPDQEPNTTSPTGAKRRRRPTIPTDHSPLARRSARGYADLVVALLELPTLGTRLTYLLDHESFAYLEAGRYVLDAEHVTAQTQRIHLSPADIAEWVGKRSGHGLTRGALHRYTQDGIESVKLSTANAFADFWHINPRLFDPQATAATIAASDPHLDPSSLAEAAERAELRRGRRATNWTRADDLLRELGLSVDPAEVQAAFAGTGRPTQKLLITALEAMRAEQNRP